MVVIELVAEAGVLLVQLLVVRGIVASADAQARHHVGPCLVQLHLQCAGVVARLLQRGVVVLRRLPHVVGTDALKVGTVDDTAVEQCGVEQQRLVGRIVHLLLQLEHRRGVEVLLLRQVVGIGGLLCRHLCHVGLALQPHLLLYAGLVERGVALCQLLTRHAYRATAVQGLYVCLERLESSVVLLLLQGGLAHEGGGMAAADFVDDAAAAEQRYAGGEVVVVVEGGHVVVRVGLRVNASAEVVLCADRSLHPWQEAAEGLELVEAVVLQLQLALADGMVVADGILHAAVHSPHVLCLRRRDARRGKQHCESVS